MSRIMRHFRGVFVALATLALSAGVVFGWNGPSSAADNGLAKAAAASGQTEPARAEEQPTADAGDEDADAPDAEAPEADAPDAEDSATDTHGDLVSEAAQMETPAAFDGNHGAFVSCVARMNHGHEDPNAQPPAAPLDLTTLTPEDCSKDTTETSSPTAHGNSAAKNHTLHGKSGQSHGHGH